MLSHREEATSSVVTDTDWKSTIRSFGFQHDMGWKETLRWIANRTSLQVACEILGVSLSPSISTRYTSDDLAVLNALGHILDSAGYQVPRLMENHRLQYSRKEPTRVGFSLSREEYLQERASGKSKNRIAHEQGISGPALFHWLQKWGLKDSEYERREIERLARGSAGVTVAATHAVAGGVGGAGGPGPGTAHAVAGGVGSPGSGTAHAVAGGVGSPGSGTAHAVAASVAMGIAAVADGHGGPRVEPMRTAALGRMRLDSSRVVQTLRPELADIDSVKVQRDVGCTETRVIGVPSNNEAAVTLSLRLPASQLKALSEYAASTTAPARSGVEKSALDECLTRDEKMQAAIGMLLGAVGQAYHDLADMLGEAAAADQIQQYVNHQLTRFMEAKEH